MNYKTYYDLSLDINNNIHKVPPGINIVLGVPRSGMIPAYMIALVLNVPIMELDTFIYKNTISYGATRELNNVLENDIHKKNVLIVDDSIHSGKEMNRIKDKIKTLSDRFNFIFAVVYSIKKEHEGGNVDFYFSLCPLPRIFQWNYRNHNVSTMSCYDLDGVLCLDPTEEENDDGPKYIDFILNAKPLYIPKYEISCIVTSRLTKYREYTEEWLRKNNVQYKELIMLDLPSKEERIRLKAHALFKANIYEQRKEILFFESNWYQAKQIVELTNKPVICLENDIFIPNRNFLEYNTQYKKQVLSNKEVADIIKEQAIKIQQKEQELIKIYNSDLWIVANKLNKIAQKTKLIPIIKYLLYLKKL